MIRELTIHVWQSTLFAVAAGLLTMAFRRNRARVRYSIWLSASLKFFIPFALLTGLGRHLGWVPAAHKIATPEIAFTLVQISQPFPEPLPFGPSVPGATDWTPIVILGIWACGLTAIMSIRLRSWLRIRTVVRASTPLSIPVAVEVRSSPGLLEPGVVGLWRPVLLLPERLVESLTPFQLDAVLAHELCHVRRRDNLFAAIHMIVEALFWFHPLVWWLGARLVAERERACDEEVLSLGSEPRIYADAILSVCRLCVESPLACVSGVTGGSVKHLKQRIEAIMTNRTGQGLNRAKKFLLAAAGVAALAGPVAIGVAVGVGNAPAIRAQSPATVPSPVRIAQAIPAAAFAAAPQAAQDPYQDHRMVAMLFDFGSMTSDEQSRTRQSAIDFVHTKLEPADIVAVMAVNNGKAAIVRDFTDDRAVLESSIMKLSAGDGVAAGLSSIESAANVLAALPGKKALIYFSNGAVRAGTNDDAGLSSAVKAAQAANVAIYPIDARGITPQIIAQNGPGGRSMTPQSAPEGVSQDEYDRRRAYAQEKFGTASSAMGRTYIRYGPPDTIDDRGSGAQNSPQIWRYNYLENFHSSVEFEFTAWNGHLNVRINWPPPLATYEGVPTATSTSGGLPGGHASFQMYPAGEFQVLSVPLNSLSGRIDLEGRITRQDAGATGQNVAAFVSDDVQAPAGTYQANFILPIGSYACALTVREQATGQTYAEMIAFAVK